MAFNEGALLRQKGCILTRQGRLHRGDRLNTKFAKAFNNRGFAYKNKGDYERAIADYTDIPARDRC